MKCRTIAAAVLLVCSLPLYAQQTDSPSRQCLGRRCSITMLMSRHNQQEVGGAKTSQLLGQADDNTTYITFDPPGSILTDPSAITAAGVIIGSLPVSLPEICSKLRCCGRIPPTGKTVMPD